MFENNPMFILKMEEEVTKSEWMLEVLNKIDEVMYNQKELARAILGDGYESKNIEIKHYGNN